MYQTQDLINLFGQFGLHIYKMFGSYQLDEYVPELSERMILVFKNETRNMIKYLNHLDHELFEWIQLYIRSATLDPFS